jgi:hypothetical protein
MDTLKYLIPYFLKISFTFFFAAFVWWAVSLFFPALSFSSIIPTLKDANASSTRKDILPSPRLYASLFGNRASSTGTNGNLYVSSGPYVHGEPFNGYALDENNQYTYSTYDYTTYTYSSDGSVATSTSGGSSTKKDDTSKRATSTPEMQRNLYVRNLSIYEGGHVYTGLSFVGEARASLFREGKFPIVIIDQSGRVVGMSYAVATTNWAIPGWVRFETKINYVLPNKVPCLMIFEEMLTEKERVARKPARLPMSVMCN